MGPMLQGAQRYGLLGDVEPVMSCDSDLSGRVTREEFMLCAQKRFALLDKDHNGRIERTELVLYRDRQRERDD
jgi:Ca2+-binding EF-hand superfamily protein